MKRILSMILTSALLLGTLTACGGQTTSEGDPSSTPSASEETRQESTTAPSDSESVSPDESETTEPSSEATEKKLKMTVNGQEVLITLYDTPTANALYAALPMELNFSDYNGTEKIAYPPEALPTEGEPDGCDPDVGDLCLYAPWGNLCIFYQDFRYSQSLIKLGHIESGMELLTGTSGDFTVTLERMD